MLWIKKGSKLELDKDAIVILESPESNIRLDGELIINGDIKFSGKGFFDFQYTHTLTLGPNADAFRLKGFFKTNRFIRINGATILQIPTGKGIDLQNGAIENLGTIKLAAGSFANFKSNRIYGNNEATQVGIQGENVGNFIMTDALVEGISRPIYLNGSVSYLYTKTIITHSLFRSAISGGISTEMRYRGGVTYGFCEFEGNSKAGVAILSVHNLVVKMQECTVKEFTQESSGGTDPSQLSGRAIVTEGDWVYWMLGGEINNCNVGIISNAGLDTDSKPSNILLTGFATIRDCYAGIHMIGDDVYGQVIMDCARLINNRYGIYGNDITLVISPFALMEIDGQYHKANIFIRPSSIPFSEYIHVCYIAKPNILKVLADGNYWGNNGGGGLYPDGNPSSHVYLRRPNGGQACAVIVPITTNNPPATEPRDCLTSGGFTGPNPDDCTMAALQGSTIDGSVGSEYRLGLAQLENEQYSDAQEKFNNLAIQWQPNLTNLTKYCQTFIQSAKALANGSGFSPPNNDDRSTSNTSGNFLIWPNPTSGEVMVQHTNGSNNLRIWDIYGRLILTVTNADHFNTVGWTPGIYFVESLDLSGNREIARLKVE